ncbi:MAG TPA: hypothetical protein PLZ27_06670, partial [Bacillota bacterium]|nr:hypothetical protein [Bacillota bacterium]
MNKTRTRFINLLITVFFIGTLVSAILNTTAALDISADNTIVSQKTVSLTLDRPDASNTDIADNSLNSAL